MSEATSAALPGGEPAQCKVCGREGVTTKGVDPDNAICLSCGIAMVMGAQVRGMRMVQEAEEAHRKRQV